MNDPWSQSLALLYSPTVPRVQWPSARRQRVTYGQTDAPAMASMPSRPDIVKRPGLDATDVAVLEMVRSRPQAGTSELAQEHGLPRRTLSRRLLRLNALGLVRANREGLWTAVDSN